MRSMKTPVMEQLAMQLRFAPPRQKRRQVAAAQKLLGLLRPNRQYPFEFVCFHITGYRPKKSLAEQVIAGEALISDLLVLIRKLSRQATERVDETGQKVYSLHEAAGYFDVAPRTIERWQKRGLAGKQYLFEGGKYRIGFTGSELEQFEKGHPAMVSRARKFGRMSASARRDIVGRARELARKGASRKEALEIIASECNRTKEAVRYHLARHESQSRERIFGSGGAVSPERMHEIHRLHQSGVSVAELMKRFNRSRSSVYRIINAARARELLGVHMEYVDSEEFVADDAEQSIMAGELPPGVAEPNTLAIDLEQGKISLHEYLKALPSIPSLNAETEKQLFRRYNYVKYRFNLEKVRMDVAKPSASQVKTLRKLLAQAKELGRFLWQSYLRLVVSIAQKHQIPPENLQEYVIMGNRALTRALDSYDYQSSSRFAGYANLAIVKEFARARAGEPGVPAYRPPAWERGVLALDTNSIVEAERKDRDIVNIIRQNLDERQQKIIMSRYPVEYAVIRKPPKSVKELASELSVSPDEVRRLELAAISKLRHVLSDDELRRITGENA